MYNYYTEMQNAMQTHNLTAQTMIEGQVAFSFGYNFTGTFYNCTTEILDTEMQYTNYNDCSLVLHMNHNGVTSLYAGDNTRLDRLVTNDLLTSQLDFLKISHHGLIGDTDCKNAIYDIQARPYYAMQPNGPSAPYQGSTATNVEVKLLSDLGTKIYATDEQEEDVIFESSNKQFYCLQGKRLIRTSSKICDVKYYVDSRYAYNDSNGSSVKPFRSLIQAIAACDTQIDNEYHIYIQNYDVPVVQSYQWRLGAPKNLIYIHGLSDNTAITIAEQFNFQNGNGCGKYIFENITFDTNISTEGSLFTINRRSDVEFRNCRFINTGTIRTGQAIIWASGEANLKFYNCYFDENIPIGISIHEKNTLLVRNCTFNVEQTPILAEDGGQTSITEFDNTYLRVYERTITHNDDCIYNAGLGPMNIWSGSAYTNDDSVIYTTNFPLTEAFMLVIETGNVSNNTFKVDFLKGYKNNTILAGKYYINTYHPLIRIKLRIIDAYHFSITYIDDREIEDPTYNNVALRNISVWNYGRATITYDLPSSV